MGAGLRVHRAPPAQRCGPPAGNSVPREQREPSLTTNCSVIFLPLPGRQQAEHLKQQGDAAGSFKAVDGFPSGLHTSFLHLSPSLPLAPPGFVNTAPSLPPSLLPPLPPSHQPRTHMRGHTCSPLTFRYCASSLQFRASCFQVPWASVSTSVEWERHMPE